MGLALESMEEQVAKVATKHPNLTLIRIAETMELFVLWLKERA